MVAVPTIWLGVFQELKKMNISKLDLKIITGGSACPPSLMEGGSYVLHK